MRLEHICRAFGIEGTFAEGGAFGNGLINDTFAASFEHNGNQRRYIIQRINHRIFRDPVALMENVDRVCAHLRNRLINEPCDDINRRSLTLVRTHEGQALHCEPANAKQPEPTFWRCFHFIEGCTSYDVVDTPDQAYQAARKFGEFQRLVSDLPGTRLIETIPDFHNTPKRFAALQAAIAADPLGRAAQCREEIEFALANESIAHHLLGLHAQGLIPERITHNDTKLSNVLIDDQSGLGMCVVDLDTVMPGLSLYDFGDLIRTCVSPIEEDSRDLASIHVRLPIFQALARGFLEEMAGVLTPTEIANLPFSGKLFTFEVGLRFLADHLLGDQYFAAKRPNHNLHRARNQFQLVRQLNSHQNEMNDFVKSLIPPQ
jgi:Ser/Thr protein kinase RdoA (MazF antagonist)